jgi:hypothetical protein
MPFGLELPVAGGVEAAAGEPVLELGAADATPPPCACAKLVRADPRSTNTATTATIKYFNSMLPVTKSCYYDLM